MVSLFTTRTAEEFRSALIALCRQHCCALQVWYQAYDSDTVTGIEIVPLTSEGALAEVQLARVRL